MRHWGWLHDCEDCLFYQLCFCLFIWLFREQIESPPNKTVLNRQPQTLRRAVTITPKAPIGSVTQSLSVSWPSGLICLKMDQPGRETWANRTYWSFRCDICCLLFKSWPRKRSLSWASSSTEYVRHWKIPKKAVVPSIFLETVLGTKEHSVTGCAWICWLRQTWV